MGWDATDYGDAAQMIPNNGGRIDCRKLFLIICNFINLTTMRNTMPSVLPLTTDSTAAALGALGQKIRAHRKGLRVSATAAAEAAGMSRVTLHRIEKGEPSVTMGAYLNAIAALGLDFGVVEPSPSADHVDSEDKAGWIPARISLADYPQLKQLAWQVNGTDALSPVEVQSIYERNWRHVNVQALQPKEQQLIDALKTAFGATTGASNV
jgi:transcriptional regulator with XRE-family HTH domain